MKKIKRALILTVLFIVPATVYFIPEKRKESHTAHFSFHFSSSIDTATITSLANALENNYERIGNDLQTKPAVNIEVNIYAQRWRYIKATKNWSASGNIEGISKLHFVQQAWGDSDTKKVAVHEFAHTVTLKLLLDNEPPPVDPVNFDKKFAAFPVWLWEAISVYEAQQFVDPETLPYFRDDHYPGLEELNSRMKGGKIYSCGFTIVEYIITKYGRENLLQLVKNYGDLRKTFNITNDQFSKDWYGFVRRKYLK